MPVTKMQVMLMSLLHKIVEHLDLDSLIKPRFDSGVETVPSEVPVLQELPCVVTMTLHGHQVGHTGQSEALFVTEVAGVDLGVQLTATEYTPLI